MFAFISPETVLVLPSGYFAGALCYPSGGSDDTRQDHFPVLKGRESGKGKLR